MALVSVVIPVYNGAGHLGECIDSVLGQSLSELEIICVDDGSTDDTPQILAGYAKSDSRFRVITQQNAGPGAARNAGLAAAAGEYLIFLDADDRFEPDFLELMLAKARETGAEAVICRAQEFDSATGRRFPPEWMLKTGYLTREAFAPEELSRYLYQFTYGWPWDKLFCMDMVRRERLDYPRLTNSEDLVFVFKALACANKIAVLDRVLVHHRINRASSVSNSRAGQPDAPYIAFRMVWEYLEGKGLLEIYRYSLLCWAADFLIWHVVSMKKGEVRKRYHGMLRREWLPSLQFDGPASGYFESRPAYCKYLIIRYAPYPVFAALLDGARLAKTAASAARRPFKRLLPPP